MSQGSAPPQDGLLNAPSSAQDGSKSLLKSDFYALENRLKFCLVSGGIFNRFGLPNGGPKVRRVAPFFPFEIGFHLEGSFCRSKTPQEVPKRCPRAPRDLPKMPSGDHFWQFWRSSWTKFAPKSQEAARTAPRRHEELPKQPPRIERRNR